MNQVALKNNSEIHDSNCNSNDTCWHGVHTWLRYQSQFVTRIRDRGSMIDALLTPRRAAAPVETRRHIGRSSGST